MTRFTQRDRQRPGYTYLDLLVIVILIPFLVVGVACWRQNSGHGSSRIHCASNLRQIGQAILLYSNENRGAYPRTIATTGETVVPVWGTGAGAKNPFAEDGPKPNDVTAALFLLLRTQDITAEVFKCPSSNAVRDTFGGTENALTQSNFTDYKKHLSYSYQNPYPDNSAVDPGGFKLNNSISAEFAVASDINPGTAGGNDNVLAVKTTSSASEMKQGNSNNHDGDGQNVLYGDGHVEFQQNPFVGVQRDNIFTRAGEAGPDRNTQFSDGILRSSRDGNDSVLLPTDD